ncbi:MAG: hypothetical protein ACRDJ4_09080 [Actinomycetota bacterium]
MSSAGERSRAASAVGWTGLVIHVLLALFPFSASGLLAPLYGVIGLYVLWAALLVVAVRLLRTRPFWTPIAPGLALAGWFLVLLLGDLLLGWTA